jgi:hypothetical protein
MGKPVTVLARIPLLAITSPTGVDVCVLKESGSVRRFATFTLFDDLLS